MLRLDAENKRMKLINDQMRESIKRANHENRKMADIYAVLAFEIKQVNQVVLSEAQNRAQAEIQATQHQAEIKRALVNVPCSIIGVPIAVVEQLQRQAEAMKREQQLITQPSADTHSSKSINTVPATGHSSRTDFRR